MTHAGLLLELVLVVCFDVEAQLYNIMIPKIKTTVPISLILFIFFGIFFDYLTLKEDVSDEEFLDQVTLFDLMVAFRKALDNMPKVTYHEVRKIDVTVEQQAEFILNKLKTSQVVLFQDIIREIKEKIVLIVTFVSLLELVRDKKIIVRQSKVFDDIRIKSREAA